MTDRERLDAAALDEAARAAAAAGDYQTAARHLRNAAAAQERALGPVHPDLVHTWNNLGVVLERLEQPHEAEAAFRRSHAIARQVFEPGHPTVVTSETNLREFCAARGVPFELPRAPAPAPPPAQPPEPAKAAVPPPAASPAKAAATPPRTPAPAVSPPAPPVAKKSPDVVHQPRKTPAPTRTHTSTAPEPRAASSRVLVIAGAVVLVIALIAWLIFGGTDESASAVPAPAPAPGAVVAGEPSAPIPSDTPPPARTESTQPAAGPTASSARASVVLAELCRSLTTRAGGEWTCQPAGASVRPGPLVFYTRVRISSPATIQHRWYHADDLRQQVDLAVRPNTSAGYRTYSRRTMETSDAGVWRVEARSDSGALLHQERFVVSLK